jgi:crotonobetainyl-CoA:carnitine CoA-transferase CaiB-like acyl-CoA transferase
MVPQLPLSNLRIIELANLVAGPSVGKHLSDFGAEVIKIERPGDGDSARIMGEFVGSRSAWWLSIGRNKHSVTLNLKHPKGREVLLRLVESADALVESFRPGVLERLDLAPEKLQEVNDRLVVVRLSAFGQTGPYSGRPGFGTLAEAFSGLADISGHAGHPPLLASFALADEVAGLFATWALLAALYYRDVRGGPGQTIDVSLYESVFNILGPLPTLYKASGNLQERNGSRLAFSSPRNVYRTRDGHYFAVSGTTPSAAETVVRLVGGDELLTDPRFSTHEARAQHAEELDDIVAQWVAERDSADVDQLFQTAGAAGIRVLSMADIFEDPHYRERAALVEMESEDGDTGSVTLAAPVPRMSATPARVAHVGRALGHDTDRVLRDLGYSAEEIELGREDAAW